MSITFRDEQTGLDLASYLGVGLTHGTWPWTLAANLCIAAMVSPLYKSAWYPSAVCSWCRAPVDSTHCPWCHTSCGFEVGNTCPASVPMMVVPSWRSDERWLFRMSPRPLSVTHLDFNRQLSDALEAVDRAGTEPDAVCAGCRNLIDSTVCHCGEPMDGHSMDDGHTPVPSGCDCLREP